MRKVGLPAKMRQWPAPRVRLWCPHCDWALVGEYGKCPRCRKDVAKPRRKTRKKDTKAGGE